MYDEGIEKLLRTRGKGAQQKMKVHTEYIVDSYHIPVRANSISIIGFQIDDLPNLALQCNVEVMRTDMNSPCLEAWDMVDALLRKAKIIANLSTSPLHG